MTVTLTMPQLVALAAACTLWGVVVGAAVMLDVMRPGKLPPIPLNRLADPAPLPGELGPFPDTGPLILESEHAAARDALARDVRVMVARADELIPARWR